MNNYSEYANILNHKANVRVIFFLVLSIIAIGCLIWGYNYTKNIKTDSMNKILTWWIILLLIMTVFTWLPHKIDIELNTHFNTDITAQIDYNNDLELTCEYGILMPLQFEDLHFNYADTISEIKLNLEETLEGMGLSVTQVELALSMNLKNTLPLGLTLNLTPLDAKGNVVEGVEIGSIELPAGDGSAIGTGESVKGTPVELSIKCASASALAELDKVVFQLDVASGNGNNALAGSQGLQVSDIVLQIMCDVEVNLSK